MLVMTQYHPMGLQMVQEIVFKVDQRLYDDPNEKNWMEWPWLSNLNITGPDALKSFLRSDNQLTWYNMRCSKERNTATNQWYVYLTNEAKAENRTVLSISDPIPGTNVLNKMKNCKNCNDYTKLFKNRQVYCDQPGPLCNGKNYTFF